MNKLDQTITDLWHLSRTALAGMPTVPTRHDRRQYVMQELKRTYPDQIEGMKHKHVWFQVCEVTSPTKSI
jgi:hypothetical protein